MIKIHKQNNNILINKILMNKIYIIKMKNKNFYY
jgi:hypothetical protein